jgi:shikimate dehydrogenase
MSGPDRYAVIGHPVAHSRSPAIHAAFAAQTGQRLDYDRLECPLDGFAAAVRGFADSGARGCNVTVPFKFEALSLAARATERAQRAGAANTLRFDAGGWLADNTDGVGLVRDLQDAAGWPLAGTRLLLVGAGGAGAGVLGPLLAARPARLVLANRSLDKALALQQRHQAWAAQQGVPMLACTLAEAVAHGPFDIVVNASASSLAGQASPVDAAVLAAGAHAVDLMYGAPAAPFLAWARSAGAQGRDGLGMLVEQAAEAFALWRGVRPQTAPVLQQLRAQVDADQAPQ